LLKQRGRKEVTDLNHTIPLKAVAFIRLYMRREASTPPAGHCVGRTHSSGM
jgi:hypothetical protein